MRLARNTKPARLTFCSHDTATASHGLRIMPAFLRSRRRLQNEFCNTIEGKADMRFRQSQFCF
jgi:hypothetical protein